MVSEQYLPNASALTGWRRSSHSGAGDSQGGGDCLETTRAHPYAVPVRDSTDPHGPALLFTPDAWTAFLTAVKSGELPGT